VRILVIAALALAACSPSVPPLGERWKQCEAAGLGLTGEHQKDCDWVGLDECIHSNGTIDYCVRGMPR
jgi:hypothetical protein